MSNYCFQYNREVLQEDFRGGGIIKDSIFETTALQETINVTYLYFKVSSLDMSSRCGLPSNMASIEGIRSIGS